MIDWHYMATSKVRLMTTSQSMKDAALNLIMSDEAKSERMLWLAVYNWCVINRKIKRIEDLPDDEKKDLKAFTIELCKETKLSNSEKADVSRCLIAIEYFLNQI